MTAKKQNIIDIDGTEAVSQVLLSLLNTFPGLQGKEIQFSTLSETSGISFFPTSGAAVLSSTEDITGHVKQVCLYPFTVVYRQALRTEQQKLTIKEFLDTLGKWLELQPVIINGVKYKLAKYPAIEGGNITIKTISRTNPAHLDRAYADGIEDWAISATLRYESEYDK